MPLLLLSLLTGAGPAGLRVEVSFELPRVQHNPFDFTANDVQATFLAPDGRERARPAFFDGGTTWRARLSPDQPAPGAWPRSH